MDMNVITICLTIICVVNYVMSERTSKRVRKLEQSLQEIALVASAKPAEGNE